MRVIVKQLAATLTGVVMLVAIVALGLLIFFAVRPVKTVEIKVPVPTDKSTYMPGDEIKGIFFGEIFWTGPFSTERQVICSNYSEFIKDYRDGDNTFDAVARPRKLEGVTARIGNLPESIPVGGQCIVQFVNHYTLGTPFGERHLSYVYFTQGFTIVAKPVSAAPEPAQSVPTAQVGDAATQSVVTAVAASPVPFGTDPVTQEPTQPTPRPTPTATPTPPTQSAPQPGLLSQIIKTLTGVNIQ